MSLERHDPDAPLLAVDQLSVMSGQHTLVSQVSFTLTKDSRTGLIGESGSGKSLTALAIMGLLPEGLRATGSVRLYGRELLGIGEKQMVRYRGDDIAMIFQEPMTALNPLHRVGDQVAESLLIHQQIGRRAAHDRAVELLAEVGIEEPERRARSFPFQLSGGQRQRAMIAAAIACSPDLIIADEPTTALDVTVQQQVLDLLQSEAKRNDAALLLITHDLPVVANTTDEVMVLRNGEILERGPTLATFSNPHDAYTRQLVASVPPMARDLPVGANGVDTQRPDSQRLDSQRRDSQRRDSQRRDSHGLETGPGSGVDDDAGSSDVEHRSQSGTTGVFGATEAMIEAMIAVDGVTKSYRLPRRRLFEARPELVALDNVTLTVNRGETYGIVGESGSGKSTLARIIVGLISANSGTVTVDGVDVSDAARRRHLYETAQMVFQDPNGSLDPRMRVDDIIAEPLRSLRIGGDHRARVNELLEAVQLGASVGDRYAHEFSGGQRQRIAIARALAPNPSVLVADEAVSALDMSVQTVMLDLLAELKTEFDLTMVFISHDLSVVAEICDRVAVLEHGNLVESGAAATVFDHPQQPYTKRLVAAVPKMHLVERS